MPRDCISSTTPDDHFEKVLTELLLEEEAGEPLDLSRAVRTYPELETPLREYFRDRDGFDRLAPHLAPTASQRAAQAVASDLAPGSRFAGYEIVRELGHGGMGVVYLAKQRSPKRLVALKLIRMDRLAHMSERQRKKWLTRFREEGEKAARIDDERVATVFEVGTSEGRQFYSMRYVAGRSLAEVLAEKPLKNKTAATLMEQIARVVQVIHDQGVLHRDLKPHNILVDAQGRIYVTDFGLAKSTETTEGLTSTGEVLGSVHYMSPEQAEDPAGVTESTDVYGLGATLYALLTGRPPFEGSTLPEIIHKVKYRDPAPPRRVNRDVDLDLNVITLKCLEKEPRRRFGSAKEVANELKRYLDGRPIKTRPIGPVGRTWRWSRRNPVVAALSAAAMLLIAVAGALYWANLLTRGKLDAGAEEARRFEYLKDMPKVQQHFDAGELTEALALLDKWRPGEGKPDLRAWEWFFQDAQCRQAGFSTRGHNSQVQAVAWSPGGERLASADHEGIIKIWRLADRKKLLEVPTNAGGILALAWSPNGQHLAAACPGMVQGQGQAAPGQFPPQQLGAAWLGMVRLFEADSGKETRSLQCVTDNNGFMAPAANGMVALAQQVLWDSWSASLTWSPNSNRLALVDANGKVQVWDVIADKNEPLLGTHAGGVHSAAWSPDGSRLASVGGDSLVKIWDPTKRTSEEIPLNINLNNRMQGNQSYALTWDHDGTLLHVVFGQGDIQILDLTKKNFVPGPRLVPHDVLKRTGLNSAPFGRFIWAPGGRLLATVAPSFGIGVSRSDVMIWDAATGREILTLPSAWSMAHPAVLQRGDNPTGCCPIWDPSGRRLALGGEDGMVTAQYAGSGRRAMRTPILNDFAGGIAWGSDNQHVWCASQFSVDDVAAKDKQIRDWLNAPKQGPGGGLPPPPPWAQPLPLPAPKIGQNQPPFPPGLPNLQPRPQIQLCDAITGEIVRKLNVNVQPDMLAESPSGQWLASATRAGLLQLWRLTAEGQPALTLEDPPKGGAPGSGQLAWSPDSRLLAYSTSDNTTIRLWDPNTQRQVGPPLEGHGKRLRSLAWSPDSERLASAGDDGTVQVWDVMSGKLASSCRYPVKQGFVQGGLAHTVVSTMLAWSHDGKQLAIAAEDEAIHIWNVGEDKEPMLLPGHPPTERQQTHHIVCAVAWSPDGKRLAATSPDGTFLIRDTATWQVVLSLRPAAPPGLAAGMLPSYGGTLAWSPDSKQLALFGAGAATIWDATPEAEEGR
jgi:WD40 repeat protein/serine/threonine protein kinase